MKQKDFYNSTAWKYCRQYVLLFYSIDGSVQCSTCGKWYHLPDKNIQVGHYHKSDRHRSVALDFFNLAPQCHRCNVYFSGKPDIMYQWLLKRHGQEQMNALDFRKNQSFKLDDFELEAIKNIYKNDFNNLVKLKGNPFK